MIERRNFYVYRKKIYLQNEDNNLDSLTNDLLFKETFGTPHNIKALEHLLESYFDYPNGFLKGKLAINYESILEKTRLNDKSIRSDLIIIVDNNLFVNLEMYSEFTKASLQKNKTYIMRIYSTQLSRGDDFELDIAILNLIDKKDYNLSNRFKKQLISRRNINSY